MASEDIKKNPIVIVEGVDCSGKSTLIKKLMDKHLNNMYIHNAVADDIYKLHYDSIEAACLASKTHWVFIDRLHLSEKVYGTVFRNGPSYNIDDLDAYINSHENIKKILCIIDKEDVLKLHASRKDQEMFDDVSKVYDMYTEADITWTRYNWKTDNIDLDTLEVTKKETI
jgi:thymidylate kinase